jgi:WD40 repeat protein
VWDAATGATALTYRGHTRNTWSAVWSPDGRHIASASGDGTVQVWDPSTGKPSLIYREHSRPVFIVAWSPDGTRIASGDAGGPFRSGDRCRRHRSRSWAYAPTLL